MHGVISKLGFSVECCRGSKYWQENWEKHVDYLENYSSGKLYKYVKSGQGINRKDMLDPYPYSVSKINSLLGLYIFAIWAIALIYVTYHLSIPPRYDRSTELSWYMRSVFAGLAASFIAFSAYDCRTKNSENILTTKSAFYCREETFHRTDAYNEDKLNKQTILLLLFCLMFILWVPAIHVMARNEAPTCT